MNQKFVALHSSQFWSSAASNCSCQPRLPAFNNPVKTHIYKKRLLKACSVCYNDYSDLSCANGEKSRQIKCQMRRTDTKNDKFEKKWKSAFLGVDSSIGPAYKPRSCFPQGAPYRRSLIILRVPIAIWKRKSILEEIRGWRCVMNVSSFVNTEPARWIFERLLQCEVDEHGLNWAGYVHGEIRWTSLT